MGDRVSEIRERIEAKRKALVTKSEDAAVADWTAYEAACEEHGYDAVKRLCLPRFVEGLPTFLLIKAAPADHLRIFRSKSLKARKDKGGMPDLGTIDRELAILGKACIVYPDAETVALIKAEFPSVEKDAGVIAKDMSQAEAEEEGKG
jgi:hypothetical protein